MRRILSLFTLVGLLAMFSCKKDQMPSSQALTVAPEICASETYPLAWAPEFGVAGSVTISNDANNIYVKVMLDQDVNFDDIEKNLRIWIGNSSADIPLISGECMLDSDKFPWFTKVAIETDEYTFTIPYSEISTYLKQNITCSNKLAIVVEANLYVYSGSVPATAREFEPTCSNWYFYWSSVDYQGVCCGTPPPPPTPFSGTVFAKGGYVFATDSKANPEGLPTLSLTRDRWGWGINIPAGDGSYEYKVYGGAGLNDINKGVLVGKVNIVKTGSTVKVTYTMNAGYTMSELHIYAGDLKPTTVAPGQYGYTRTFSPGATSHEATFTLSNDSNGDGFWLICHAVASSGI